MGSTASSDAGATWPDATGGSVDARSHSGSAIWSTGAEAASNTGSAGTGSTNPGSDIGGASNVSGLGGVGSLTAAGRSSQTIE